MRKPPVAESLPLVAAKPLRDSEVRTDRTHACDRPVFFPVCAGSFSRETEIKRRSWDLRTGSLGQVGLPLLEGLRALKTEIVSRPLNESRGMFKRMSDDHHVFEDAQRRADKLDQRAPMALI
jgi:hypothetical protein